MLCEKSWETDYRFAHIVHFRIKAGVDIFCHHCGNQHTCTVSVCGQQLCVATIFCSGKKFIEEDHKQYVTAQFWMSLLIS